MDIALAIAHLGLNERNQYRLTQSVPPHSIIEWNGPDAQPTETELQAAYDAAVASAALADLRSKRNQLLTETDYLALSDVTMTDEMRTYRQALRDLPANTEDPANPVWPTKPS